MTPRPRRALARLLAIFIAVLVVVGVASWLGSVPWAGLGSVR